MHFSSVSSCTNAEATCRFYSSREAHVTHSLFLSLCFVFLFHLNPSTIHLLRSSLSLYFSFLSFPPFFLPVCSKGVCRCAKLSIFARASTHALAGPRIHTRCAIAELHAMLAHEKRSRGSISLDNRPGKRGINPPRVRPRDTIFVPRLFTNLSFTERV